MIQIGCDPEFIFTRSGGMVRADTVLARDTMRVLTNMAVGTDGCASTGELRPLPGSTAQEAADSVVQIVGNLFSHAVQHGYGISAGAYPNRIPTGGHIHISGVNIDGIVPTLDELIGIPLTYLLRETGSLQRRESGGYGGIGSARGNGDDYIEYRTPPSWIVSPEMAAGTMKLAFHVATAYSAGMCNGIQRGGHSVEGACNLHLTYRESIAAHWDRIGATTEPEVAFLASCLVRGTPFHQNLARYWEVKNIPEEAFQYNGFPVFVRRSDGQSPIVISGMDVAPSQRDALQQELSTSVEFVAPREDYITISLPQGFEGRIVDRIFNVLNTWRPLVPPVVHIPAITDTPYKCPVCELPMFPHNGCPQTDSTMLCRQCENSFRWCPTCRSYQNRNGFGYTLPTGMSCANCLQGMVRCGTCHYYFTPEEGQDNRYCPRHRPVLDGNFRCGRCGNIHPADDKHRTHDTLWNRDYYICSNCLPDRGTCFCCGSGYNSHGLRMYVTKTKKCTAAYVVCAHCRTYADGRFTVNSRLWRIAKQYPIVGEFRIARR